MATVKKTTKKVLRQVTQAETLKLSKQFQTTFAYINGLLENKSIAPESKAALKKVRKSLIDAVSYSQRLSYLQR